MDDNRLYKKIVEVYLLGSIPVASVLSPALPFDMGLTFSLVSFGPVAAAMLFLAARTVARRLRYAPVEGELVGMDRKGRFFPLALHRRLPVALRVRGEGLRGARQDPEREDVLRFRGLARRAQDGLRRPRRPLAPAPPELEEPA